MSFDEFEAPTSLNIEEDLADESPDKNLWNISQASNKLIRELEHLKNSFPEEPEQPPLTLFKKTKEKLGLQLQPIALRQIPLSSRFWYLLFSLFSIFLSLFHPISALFLASFLSLCFWLESFGILRFWSIFSLPKASYNLISPRSSEKPQFFITTTYSSTLTSSFGHLFSTTQTLDLLKKKFARDRLPLWLGTGTLLSLTALSLLITTLNLAHLTLFTFALSLLILSLIALEWWFLRHSSEFEEDKEEILARLAIAFEAFQQMQEHNLPFEVRLLLLDGNEPFAAIESFLKQEEFLKSGTTFLLLEPSGQLEKNILYVKREGLFFPSAIQEELLHSLEWTSAHFQHFAPYVRMGRTLSRWIQLLGHQAVTILLTPNPATKTTEEQLPSSIKKWAQTAAFIDAFAQHLAFEKEEENSFSSDMLLAPQEKSKFS